MARTLLILAALLFCPISTAWSENFLKITLKVDGRDRDAYLHVPKNVNTDPGLLPAVIVLHGGGGNAMNAERTTMMSWVSDKNRFLLVYPEGMKASVVGGSAWNAGGCCANPMKNNVDDVKFISTLIDELRSKFRVDRKRVYVTGFSNGAQMSYRLACELSEKIAAIAPVGAQRVFEPCAMRTPVGILHIHGTQDPCALYHGGECGGCLASFLGFSSRAKTWKCPDVESDIETLSKLKGCKGPQGEYLNKGQVFCGEYGECEGDSPLILCKVEGGGHSWPGGTTGTKFCASRPNGHLCRTYRERAGPQNQDIVASEVIWEFFKNQQKK